MRTIVKRLAENTRVSAQKDYGLPFEPGVIIMSEILDDGISIDYLIKFSDDSEEWVESDNIRVV